MKTRLLRAIFLWLFLAMPWTAHAQETVLTGTVTDTTGAVLPGVTVTALHRDSGNTFVGVSDASGVYRIGALRTGTYTITAELSGFSAVVRDNVDLRLGQRATVPLQMSISTLQETVTVSGEAPLLATSNSDLGSNIDPRQMQELPLNGRDWMSLTQLTKGSRVNAGSSPSTGAGATLIGGGSDCQVNMDGQQVTTMTVGCAVPAFSRESIAEFEMVSSRFDATQGRSMGVQVNAISKSGGNQFAGTLSGYFRDDSLNAKDFIANTVLPYSNQQISTTLGGPIRRDRMHFFGTFEYEREPDVALYESPFPAFNLPPEATPVTSKLGGVRVDNQLSPQTRLMVRGEYYAQRDPFTGGGGATLHPSITRAQRNRSTRVFSTLTHVMGDSVYEARGGYIDTYRVDEIEPGLLNAPNITLRGYQIGKNGNSPEQVGQDAFQLRNDLTIPLTRAGRHEIKLGGEAMYQRGNYIQFTRAHHGLIDATGGPIPANIQELFPVWNDSSTWNLAALSPITLRVQQGFGSDGPYRVPRTIGAAWLQDDWSVSQDLTLNLGLRYDVSVGALAEDKTFPPFLPEERDSELANFQPRLGFAYVLPDTRTVIRGGFGKYYGEPSDFANLSMIANTNILTISTSNDGRPNFTADPYNGAVPTFESLSRTVSGRDVRDRLVSPDLRSSHSWQSSLGFQRQMGQTMAVEADYVYSRQIGLHTERNVNLSYDPATGANYPIGINKPYPDWGSVTTVFSDGWSSYHGLETAFTKRLSQRWQASATYTLSGYWNADGAPTGPCVVAGVIGACPQGFEVAPDLGGEFTLGVGDQRHRAVLNGLWEIGAGFQLSGLYFYGSGQRFQTQYGADLRRRGPLGRAVVQAGRLRPDGSIMPRNDFVGRPLHRVDMRLMRRFPITGRIAIDGMIEAFNLFNHENYGSYVTVETNARYGQPSRNTSVAYQPRMLQLGFRLTY